MDLFSSLLVVCAGADCGRQGKDDPQAYGRMLVVVVAGQWLHCSSDTVEGKVVFSCSSHTQETMSLRFTRASALVAAACIRPPQAVEFVLGAHENACQLYYWGSKVFASGWALQPCREQPAVVVAIGW